MSISNFFLFFIYTNRVISSTISTLGNFFYFSIIFISNIILRMIPNTNTTIRLLISFTGYSLYPIINFSIRIFLLNTFVRFKYNSIALFKKHPINIKMIVAINTKFIFISDKCFTNENIFSSTTKTFSRKQSTLTAIINKLSKSFSFFFHCFTRTHSNFNT